MQHELLPRLSVTGSWFHGTFHNLTTTVNQTLAEHWRPIDNPTTPRCTVFDPITGEAITVYGRTARSAPAAPTPTSTSSTNTRADLRRVQLRVQGAPGRGAQIFGGVAFERQLAVDCTTPDNPNQFRFCDDRENTFRSRSSSSCRALPAGVRHPAERLVPEQRRQRQHAEQGHHAQHHALSGRLPVAVPGRRGGPADQRHRGRTTVALVGPGSIFTERFTQLDLKLQTTFRFAASACAGAGSVQPQQQRLDHHLRVDQHQQCGVSASEQPGAGPDRWCGRDGSLVAMGI